MPYVLFARLRQCAVIALLAALVGCSEERAGERRAEKLVERSTATVQAERVGCAHAGEALAANCTIDREKGESGVTLTIRHPDGAFRRLAVATDGRGVVAADGAEPAQVTILDAGTIEVAIGGDRYRLPATVQAGAAIP
jgi:hypothetical protein